MWQAEAILYQASVVALRKHLSGPLCVVGLTGCCEVARVFADCLTTWYLCALSLWVPDLPTRYFLWKYING